MKSYRFQLSVMMFLEFFIWGAWLPLIFGYLPSLGFNPEWQQPLVLAAFPLAAFTAMFFSTQFADRNFAAEKFLAASQFIGGLAMIGLFFIRKPDDVNPAPFWPFFALMLVHCLFYVPTISITNSIAFANLENPQRDFGPVRLWGTIGWIFASVPFVFLLADWAKIPEFGSVPFTDWLGKALGTSKAGADLRDATRYTFLAAGSASILLAGFSLVLPHTPPKPAAEGGESLAWLEAMKLLRIPFVLVLFVVTACDALVHDGYFVWAGRYLEFVGIPGNWIMPVMTVGQIAEIGTMAFLGLCLKKLGWRYTMVIGVLGHTARFAVFAYAPQYMAKGSTELLTISIAINVLHGICYAFFFATVYIFVDEFFPKDARSSAQGLFNLLILGVGPLVGKFLWPRLGAALADSEGVPDYGKLFLVPAGIALAAALVLFLFFHPPKSKEDVALLSMEPHTQPEPDTSFRANQPS